MQKPRLLNYLPITSIILIFIQRCMLLYNIFNVSSAPGPHSPYQCGIFLYSIPSNFLELIVNSESEDVVSNSPWITTENTGFVTLFFFFLFFLVLNEPFLYHPARILNLMSLAFYHSIFCADMVEKKRGFSSSQTCRKVIVQFHCQEVTYLLNAKSVLFLHQNIFSPNLFNQHSHILCSGIFLKHLESTASRMVRCLTTFL